MKDLKTIRLIGLKNEDNDMDSVSALESEMNKASVLNDGTGYVGNDGVYITTYFTKGGVYTVATNGLGVNRKEGGMWNANYYSRNTAGYARVLDNCKNDDRKLIGNRFSYPIRGEA